MINETQKQLKAMKYISDRVYQPDELAVEICKSDGKLLYLQNCERGRKMWPEPCLHFEVYSDWPIIYPVTETEEALVRLKGSWELIDYDSEQTEKNFQFGGLITHLNSVLLRRLFDLDNPHRKLKQMKLVEDRDSEEFFLRK